MFKVFVQFLSIYRAIATFIFIIYNTKLSPNENSLILLSAIISDFIDGYFARKFNVVTVGGKLLDLFSDKYLTIIGSLYLISNGYPLLPLIIIITREVFLLSFRSIDFDGGFIIKTNKILGAITVIPLWFVVILSFHYENESIRNLIRVIGFLAFINLIYKVISNWSNIKKLFLS